jgi:hypothetical protein
LLAHDTKGSRDKKIKTECELRNKFSRHVSICTSINEGYKCIHKGKFGERKKRKEE